MSSWIYIPTDEQRQGIDIRELPDTHTHTHTLKQTIKVNHFSSDIQIKTKRSPEDCITGVVRAYDSFITVVWNADQARGTLLFTPEPLPTLLSYKSFFAFPRPACVCVFLFFFSLLFWWFINMCTLHARLDEMSPRLLASAVHLVMRNHSSFCCFRVSSVSPCPKL